MDAAGSKSPDGRPGGAESARRVLDLLLAFSRERHTMTTRELGQVTGIPMPTVYRYVAFLREIGLLVERGKAGYSLSARVMSLAEAAEAAETLIDIAHPVMRRLSAEVDETVILVRLIAGAAVCVHRIESRHRLRISFEPGQPLSLEGGASARLLLASMSPADRHAHLSGLAQRDPERAAWLEKEAALAAERGWATSEEEIDPGVWAASAAIRENGRIVASLSVPSPLARVEPGLREALIEHLRAAADEINGLIAARQNG